MSTEFFRETMSDPLEWQNAYFRGDNKEMKISILMEKPVLRITEDASALEAAVMMGNNHVGSLLATRDDANIGIITERDIMSKVIANKRNLETVPIKEILSQPIVMIDQDRD
jgi:CBS domain-containing protein